MVQTFDSNQFQLHSQLLRHGQLAWVTRGTFFGDQRNYLELHVDDVFLPDDIWDPTTHTTNFNPEAAVRMTPGDVATAVAWSRATGLRLDSLYNGGGSVAYAAEHGGSDPLLTAFQANRPTFGWVNHTYDHPNLDCSAQGLHRRRDPAEHEVGEVAGLRRQRRRACHRGALGAREPDPRQPRLDRPAVDRRSLGHRHGRHAARRHVRLRGHRELAARRDARLDDDRRRAEKEAGDRIRADRLTAICHAVNYKVYRRLSPAGAWRTISTIPQPSPAFNSGGAVTIRFRDIGTAGTAATPPSVRTRALDPYGQNPAFQPRSKVGIRNTGGDASKPYPVTPTSATGPTYPAGTSFVEGRFRVIPR